MTTTGPAPAASESGTTETASRSWTRWIVGLVAVGVVLAVAVGLLGTRNEPSRSYVHAWYGHWMRSTKLRSWQPRASTILWTPAAEGPHVRRSDLQS